MSQIMGPVYSRKDYAGFVRRTCALMVDCTIILIFLLAITMVSVFFGQREDDPLLFFLVLMFGLAYMLGFRMTTGGTLGYRILRIKYAYMLGENPPVLSVVFRSVLSLGLMMIFALDHFWILFDERKQAWHDKVSGFYVVKTRAEPLGSTQMVRRFVSVLAMPLFVWEPLDERNLIPRPRAFCRKCGYSLAGNTSGTCPECGESTTVEAGMIS